MTQPARPWLPAGHLTCERVRSAVSGAVGAWSEAWFGRPLVRLSTLRVGETGVVARAGWLAAGSLGISLSRRSAGQLLGLALDATLDQQPQTETDQEVLEHLERAMMSDLGQRLEQALGMGDQDPGPRSEGGAHDVVASLWDADGEIAQVSVPQSALVALVRRHAPPPRTSTEALTRRTEGLGPQEVSLEATLGVATLSLEEFRNLAPGDVLVLGTALDDLLALSIAGAAAPVAQARLTQADGQMALALQN